VCQYPRENEVDMSELDATTFKGSAPIWALECATQKGIAYADVIEAKITEKQAILTVRGEDKPVKVFRRHAFPGRSAE
jgi:hypothetical protein